METPGIGPVGLYFHLEAGFSSQWDSGGEKYNFLPVYILKRGHTLILSYFLQWLTFMLLLLLSHFSHVQLRTTPSTAAHQPPPSLGFSRQEHWSGLPFLSPMQESEKWKWSHSVLSDSVTPWTAAYQAPLSMGFSRQEYWSGLPLPSL